MKITANEHTNSLLCLSDGMFFFGKSIGNNGCAIGEICFNTAITGYQEILSDPSYNGQIITFTFPHIGNVGCNNQDLESSKIHCKGFVLSQDVSLDSNYRSEITLNEWAKKNNLIAICNIDTRQLTKHIRINGAKNGIIYNAQIGEVIDTDKLISQIKDLPTLKDQDLASKISISEITYYQKTSSSNINIAVIDFGVKENIINCLKQYDVNILIMPANSSYQDILDHNINAVLLSNGPGDPVATSKIAKPLIDKLLENNIPIFGICLGHQLLALSCGLKTIKMHQGHRGANHPVKNYIKNIVEITSQNHGFCVDDKNIADNIIITHKSLFDNTIQGIKLKDKPAFSVQYHPESSPGPHDSRYLFDEFIKLIKDQQCQK